MQQHKRASQPRQFFHHRPSLLVPLGAAALLTLLALAGWSSVRAAPQAGEPTLVILDINDLNVTLQFNNWALGETLSVSYSPNISCSPSTLLPGASFPVSASSFSETVTLPGDIQGTYHFCATDPADGTIASSQTITVNGDGTAQSTPGSPGTTPTTASGSPTPNSTTPGATGTTGPGNQGTSTTAPKTNNSTTLVAIILLCLLVMALLAYLIRIWLQGRQPSSPPPTSGRQP